jgi:hypothetical protein
MNRKIIILIVAILIIAVIVFYFALPLSTQAAGIGKEVFGNSSGATPPSLP